MKSFTIEQYRKSGCQQVKPGDIVGFALHDRTKGRICDTGCFGFDNGRCPYYLRLTGAAVQKKVSYSETVREEAARRNMGIKAVRRERRELEELEESEGVKSWH